MSVAFNLVQEIGSTLMAINGLSLPEAAKAYMERGFPIFPVERRGTKALVRGLGPAHATTDPARNIWWQGMKQANIGIPTGAPGGIIAVETEGSTGCDNLARLEKENGPLPKTAWIQGPLGRFHLFRTFENSHEIRLPVRTVARAVRIHGYGGHILAPPSKIRFFRRFSWERGTPIAEMPSWLFWARLKNN